MSKIAVVGLYHETNTFAPDMTELDDFQGVWVVGNEAFLQRYEHTRTTMGGVVDALRDTGCDLSAGLYTGATPSGLVSKEAIEVLMDSLLSTLDLTADGVVVILHGAMVAQNVPDVEGEILRRIREKIGFEKPVAITLDLHANISRQMVDHTDVLVGYDTYPHIDIYERAVEAVRLLVRHIQSEITPVKALSTPRMIIVPQVMLTDEEGPMKEIMERVFEIEDDPRVLNVTAAGGFPFSDIPDAGMAFVVTTNGDQELADQYAEELSRMAWDRREHLKHIGSPPKEAVTEAMSTEQGPVILVEGSDNVGGGAPADATHTLKYLINPPKKSLIVIRDEAAALAAHRLGVGTDLNVEVGGKSGKLHGDSVRIRGVVRLLSDGKFTHTGTYMTGQWADMGKTAVIEVDHLIVVLTEKRTPPFDPGHIVSLGLRPEDFHVIVVKSAIAWKTAFGSVARHVISVDTPGCCSSNLFHFEYKQLKRPIYPLDFNSNTMQ